MIYISELAGSRLISCLKQIDEVTLVRPTDALDERINTHADLCMCRINDKVIFAGPGELGKIYPDDCRYNGASTGRYLIGNTDILADTVLKEAKDQGLDILHVRQGYARCNVLPVDEASIITSDKGICGSVSNVIDVLLIRPGHILLPGFKYGFIGGTGGRIGDTIYFNGDIDSHPDGSRIRSFIEKRKLKIVSFDHPLEDIGSII